MAVSTSKYQGIFKTLGLPTPSWVSEATDAMRVAAYDGFSAIYDNVPETFKVYARGDEDHPIYVPSASKIIETVNRYLGKDWQWSVNSLAASAEAGAGQVTGDTGPGPMEAKRLEIQRALAKLFVREEVPSKFYSIKRNMLKKGDAIWHVTVNEAMPEGERLSILELDPRNFFRIPDPSNDSKTIGCYIVDLIRVGTTDIARRVEYRRIMTDQQASDYGVPVGQIFTRLSFWEPNGWDDRWIGHPELKAVAPPEPYGSDEAYAQFLEGGPLPLSVKALPVYHIRNKRDGSDPWGTSQLSGLETLIAAVNQGISDEDLTLALQGIGVYATDSPPPRNEDGSEGEWWIAPAAVIEVQMGRKFERVSGVSSVQPFQDHLRYLEKKMDESAGISEAAAGRVDANVAKSGVALRLEMAPILAANEEKELELLSKMDQFLHDLVFMWLPLEGVNADPDDISVTNSFGDPLPLDREAIIKEVSALVTSGLMSKPFAIEYLSAKLGYQFPSDMLDSITADEDRVAARMAAELGMDFGAPDTPEGDGSAASATTGAPSGTALPA